MPVSAINGLNDNLTYSTSVQNDKVQNRVDAEKQVISPEKVSEKNASDDTYGQTISVSDDGDTVQAAKEAMLSASLDARVVLMSNDGTVTKSEDEDALINKNIEKEMVDDLTGMTSSQVELLYRQGRVSYQDYTKNMEKREELKESLNPINNQKNEDVSEEKTVDELDKMNSDQIDSEKRELIDQQKKTISEFDKEIGKLAYDENVAKIENIALNTAIDNGNFENIVKFGLV